MSRYYRKHLCVPTVHPIALKSPTKGTNFMKQLCLNIQRKINRKFNCETFNCIYMIECRKCDKKYIGQTGRQFKYRIADHKGYVKNQVTSQPIGAHFNLPGHCLAHMQTTVLEQVKYRDETYRIEREKYFINKFNTFYNGLNREY